MKDYKIQLGSFDARHLKPNDYLRYTPCHCWHYFLFGPIILPEHIEPASHDNYYIPKHNPEKIKDLHNKVNQDLQSDIACYKESASNLDTTNIDNCMSVSLKYAHISYNKGYLKALENYIPKQISLFNSL